jgi:hypothetical protein
MKGKGRFRFHLLGMIAIVLLWGTGLPATAQEAGSITGHIQDGQGQALEGVAVKLMRAGKPDVQEKASDAQGNFQFGDLSGGVYIATLAKEGYAPVTCPGLRIVGLSRQLQITLAPAGGEPASSCKEAAAQ